MLVTQKKPLIAIVVLILLGWYYATPYLAVNSMRAAAEKKDAAALSEYVDYPAVRENLKSTFKAKMADVVTKEAGANPFAALGMMLAGSFVDVMVDAMVSPQGIAKLMRGDKPVGPKAVESPSQSESAGQVKQERDTLVNRHYSGWNRFEIEVSQKSNPEQKTKFILLRQGIASWKLSAIELPLD
jgi:hypothetical protein